MAPEATEASSGSGPDGGTVRVAVVGAGLAGLAAAECLARQGIEVVVLEASDCAGGRVRGRLFSGFEVDVGAMWVEGACQENPIVQLCERWDLQLEPEPESPKLLVIEGGKELSADEVASSQQAFTRALQLLGSSKPPYEVAEDMDALSAIAAATKRRRIEDLAIPSTAYPSDVEGSNWKVRRFAHEMRVGEVRMGSRLDELSGKWLDYDEDFDGRHPRFHRSYASLARCIAKGVEAAGVKFELRTRVERVKQQPDGRLLLVCSPSSSAEDMAKAGAARGLSADFVVVTASLGVLKSGALAFEPPLPDAHRSAIERLGFGGAERVVLEFESRFWPPDVDRIRIIPERDVEDAITLFVTFPGRPSAPPLLCGLVPQTVARRWSGRADAEVVATALAALRHAFGIERVSPLVRSHVTRWASDPSFLGGWSILAPGSSPADFDALATPAFGGRLLLAGEATSRLHFSTAHGAYLSGGRAASLVLAGLATRGRPACEPGGGPVQDKRTSVLTLVYVRSPEAGRVLLGMKKRGFGAGKLNGFGGKVEEGETPAQGAARELQEECGLTVAPEALRFCGQLTYAYDSRPKQMRVHVFDVRGGWQGEPVETEEMRPVWFDEAAVPLKDMWADDEHWLPQYLAGELPVPFEGRFRFKGHEGEDSYVILDFEVGPAAAAA